MKVWMEKSSILYYTCETVHCHVWLPKGIPYPFFSSSYTLLRWNTSEEAPRHLPAWETIDAPLIVATPSQYWVASHNSVVNPTRSNSSFTLLPSLLYSSYSCIIMHPSQISYIKSSTAFHQVSSLWPGCWLSSWWSGCRFPPVCRHAGRSSPAGYWQWQDSNDRHPGGTPTQIIQPGMQSIFT